jgi:hypothetical protein
VDIKLGGTASTPAPLPPTLADLEAKRPERPPTPVSAPGYEKRYARLYNNIEKAFNAKQILQFAPELGVKLRKGKGRGKEAAIKGVMKIWGWEDPQSSNVQELATKLKERDWNLTRAELWLIVRDSSCVRPALDQGVKFSIPPPTTIEGEERQVDTGMRMLRGHGSSTALSDLDQQIGHRRVVSGLCPRLSSAHVPVDHPTHPLGQAWNDWSGEAAKWSRNNIKCFWCILGTNTWRKCMSPDLLYGLRMLIQ